MECLGIPVDHRLRRLIREGRSMDANGADSKHVQLLLEFGSSIILNEHAYPMCDLGFELEMARPETKGGVLVALLRSHSTQNNSDGFLAGKQGCATLDAVSDLISTVNDSKLGFDDISVFDAIPFLDERIEGPDHQDFIDEAHDVFAEMVRAKDPDVVICCFRTISQDTLVRQLSGCGVGKSHNNNKLVAGLPFICVNAFHPSYAVNRYPIFCCFRQLLLLEFTKAFACWRQRWTEEPWMGLLRTKCRDAVKRTDNAKDYRGHWKPQYLKDQWRSLINSLTASFESSFFQKVDDEGLEDTYARLERSNITWLCCDVAWMLEKLTAEGPVALGLQPQKSSQPRPFAKKLENSFYNLLRDLNLSFKQSDIKVLHNQIAQAHAFRRFAASFEGLLEETLEQISAQEKSQENSELCDEFTNKVVL
ncbi:hypothetical protein N7517_001657 [Penicillium concentricum]|uniref:Uncharacterized protein n=1 Tax=Penicillium concentricum TaxID=293559 RepID=A0A9W9SS81_9EURO|nr:uncharacterized protein N7517_001657 [Penicillium concentricum]KAJ5383746.1 hypothetical protein N7517_001657 [Penicillium concentricum]